MKLRGLIGCGPEIPKQAPAPMLSEEKQCSQGTQSPDPLRIIASNTTTSNILPSII
jgi:hypothetical protein